MRLESEATSFNCSLAPEGLLECKNSSGEEFSLDLPLDVDYCIERAYGLQFETELVLLYEYTDALSGASRIAWISESGVLKQELRLGGFNVGRPLQEDSALYVTAIGMIGRLDLREKQWRWRHDGLYQAFRRGEIFGKPERRGAFIEFRYAGESTRGGGPGPIYTNPDSGEIVGVYFDSDGRFGSPAHD